MLLEKIEDNYFQFFAQSRAIVLMASPNIMYGDRLTLIAALCTLDSIQNVGTKPLLVELHIAAHSM